MRQHWRQWRIVYVCAAVALAIVLVGRWADRSVAVRDAGVTWLYATSPRTDQTYIVRAQAAGEQLRGFALEGGERYTFTACPMPVRDQVRRCDDSAGRGWILEL